MFQSARRIAAELDVHGPIICYQGALVADSDTGEVLLHAPLEVDLAVEILHALGPHARTTNAYIDDELYVTEPNPEAVRYAEIAGVPAWLDPLRDELQARFGDRAFVAKSLPIFLEFAAPNVSKSGALAFLGERLGFTAKQCISFGDGENDRDLLSWAGLGVCVANATPMLKAEADWVVPSVSEGGVAQFLEQLVAARASR
jgi:HAD superfamily hydrolase (TIGR01484 family)